MDYSFIHLGLDTETVEHPILMTERLASPLHSRARKSCFGLYVLSNLSTVLPVTSELLFELYNVPSAAFCVDSVMSFYRNNLPVKPGSFAADGLAVSFNSASTSIIPILGGRGLMSHAKRYVDLCLQFVQVLMIRVVYHGEQCSPRSTC